MTGVKTLQSVEIEGFKCFDQLRLEFGRLTLLTGFNGGGKSTAIQPLLLIAQAHQKKNPSKFFPLNGPLVRLGTAGDIAPVHSDRPMKIAAVTGGGAMSWQLGLHRGDRMVRAKPSRAVSGPTLAALVSISYLGAVRRGPSDSFPLPDDLDKFDVGDDGRYAPYWYDQLVDEEAFEERCHPNERATTFRKQLDAWLGTLFPGAEANVQSFPDLSLMNLQFRLRELGSWRRPSNIGYGLTYAFPILVALLGAPRGWVIVIDSPESHLHPSAQSAMGGLLARFANAGLQIIVETHSDHLLNGVRLAVRNDNLKPEDVRIHFFKGPEGREHGVTTPTLGKGGEIYEWPSGFFDQGEKDLAELAGWS